MINIKKIDTEIKDIRKFLYSKYKEYFEKTDWYCKSSEMSTMIKLFIKDTKFISLRYEDFFELSNISDIEQEIPEIYLNWLNTTLENKLLLLQFQTKTNISKEQWNKILSYIFTKEKISILYKKHEQYLKSFNFSNKKIDKAYIDNSFYNEELFNILTNYLFIIKFKDIKDLYNIDYINKEIINRQIIFNKIKNDLNLNKFKYNNTIIPNWDFKKYVFYIYSYVFWPYRNHNYFSYSFKELLEKINIDFDKSWNFNIEEDF